MDITFPTTPEAFIAYQEHLMGTPANEQQILLCEATVGLFNKAFEDGQEGRELPDIGGDFITACRRDAKEDLLTDKNVLHIVASVCWWCEEAHRQGKEAAKHG